MGIGLQSERLPIQHEALLAQAPVHLCRCVSPRDPQVQTKLQTDTAGLSALGDLVPLLSMPEARLPSFFTQPLEGVA